MRLQLPLFSVNATEVFITSTITLKRLPATMGIKKIEQCFIEGKVRQLVGFLWHLSERSAAKLSSIILMIEDIFWCCLLVCGVCCHVCNTNVLLRSILRC